MTTFGFVTTTFGSVQWQGGLWDGEGAISTKSGALTEYPYGFASRFEGKPGSNPEELVGAAHAACFTMTCRESSARPNSPQSIWRPRPKLLLKSRVTALPLRLSS